MCIPADDASDVVVGEVLKVEAAGDRERSNREQRIVKQGSI
jgi:hypothetical protein